MQMDRERERLNARRLGWLLLLLAVLAGLAIYVRTIGYGYVNYDDTIVLGRHWAEYSSLSWEKIRFALVPRSGATYQPVRRLAFILVYRLWGTDPAAYHIFNIVFYLANIIVVWFLLRRLLELFSVAGERQSGIWAGFGALWFAVHPIHVESVAWLVANKETLSGFFYFLSFYFYLKAREPGRGWKPYIKSLVLFVLGLLSKPSVAAFPLVLVGLELLLPRDRTPWHRRLVPTLPFVLPVVAVAVYFMFFTRAAGGSYLGDSATAHALTMAAVLGKYIIRMLLPVNLAHSYPPPYFSGGYDWRFALYLGLDILLFAWLAASLIRGKKAVSFGLLFFLLNLLPVSGIVPIRIFMADRYLYLSSLGFVFIGVVLLCRLHGELSNSPLRKRLVQAASAGGVVLLALLAWDRCGAWKDAVTLWSDAVEKYPNYQYNHYGLGTSLMREGRNAEAREAFERANMFGENFSTVYHLARVNEALGDTARAMPYYRRLERMYTDELVNQQEMMTRVYERLGRNDDLADNLLRRGLSEAAFPERATYFAGRLLELGRPEHAARVLRKAVELTEPAPAALHLMLARACIGSGNLREAGEELNRARSRGADSSRVRLLEADLLYASGRVKEAAEIYESAGVGSLDLRRLENLAAAYYRMGDYAGALSVFRTIAGRDPDSAPARNNLGVAYEALDSLEQARDQYLRAVELMPRYPDAWYNLGNVELARGNAGRALECYEKARGIEGFSPDIELSRAAVMLRLGRDRRALEVYETVLDSLPGSFPALLGAGDAAWSLGRQQRAAELYRRLLERHGREAVPSRVLLRASPESAENEN